MAFQIALKCKILYFKYIYLAFDCKRSYVFYITDAFEQGNAFDLTHQLRSIADEFIAPPAIGTIRDEFGGFQLTKHF